jgi:hypothetical protein
MPNFAIPISVGLAACAAAIALPAPAEPSRAQRIAELRARGPSALAELLAQYDRAPDEALAHDIDDVAAQRYATVSRLYWYTDLAAATAAARAEGKPILALRMLGRLDEDLSCANSRMFRATLYANAEVSKLLRERFVLYWSSVRAVPRVTIDFGDGRRLERTVTGNSAHYVLDADGRVLDVLPGLYAPLAFRTELTAALQLADAVRAKPRDAAALVVQHHTARVLATWQWAQLDRSGTAVGGRLALATRTDADYDRIVESALAAAQRSAMSKSFVEVPDLRRYEAPDPGALPDDALWSAIGRKLYRFDGAVLDASSRALVERLHDGGPTHLRATREQLATVIARLERHVVADTALAQIRLRPQISVRIVELGGRADFAALDAWIYANVFATPASDAWLGLLPRTDFTGLPGDGVVAL